jgi:hypothetical protein
MKYIIGYKLYERKDLELSEKIKDIFNEIYDKIYQDKFEMAWGEDFYCYIIKSDILDMEIAYVFSEKADNPSFGESKRRNSTKILPTITFPLESKYSGVNVKDILKIIIYNRSSYYHELQHLYDYVRYGRYNRKKIKPFTKDYYNSHKEVNAHFIQAISDFVEKFELNRSLRNFEEFKTDLLLDKLFRTFYNNLRTRDKNYINKRIYQVYLDLKNKHGYVEQNANLSVVGEMQKVYLPNKHVIEGVVVKKPLYKLKPLGKSIDLMEHEYRIFDENGKGKDKYVYRLKNPSQLPPIIIDKDNNIIFDYYNIYNIAKAHNFKIVNCILRH